MIINNSNYLKPPNIQDHLAFNAETLSKEHRRRASTENAPILCRLGHQLIATAETVPFLGNAIALVDGVVMKWLRTKAEPNRTTTNLFPNTLQFDATRLDYNIPTYLTLSQVKALSLCGITYESDLPCYADSKFQCIKQWDDCYLTIRRKKGELPPLNGEIVQLPPFEGPKKEQRPGFLNEGLKVRTFCLELLSNLEDLRKAKIKDEQIVVEEIVDDIIKLEEIIGVVRYFLEMGAMQEKAGFSDFLKLLALLKREAKEFRPLFERLSDLVALQEKLPKKIAARNASRWDKIRQMVQAGLINKTLFATDEVAKERGLKPMPPLPQKQRMFNLYPIIDAINLIESNHRLAGRWLMTHTQYVSFRQLCHSIRTSCEQLHQTILGWNNYKLLTINGKSQAWMADIAFRYLPKEKMPSGVIALYDVGAGDELFHHLRCGSNNLMLFDDGAYSTKQLEWLLEKLAYNVELNTPFKDQKNIVIVFGHFPREKLPDVNARYEKLKKYNVHIQIISNLLTENCMAIMEKENLNPLLRQQILDLARPDRPLLVNEWKRPDYVSTSVFVTEGDYMSIYGRTVYGELYAPTVKVETLDGIGPVTNVIPPYRSS